MTERFDFSGLIAERVPPGLSIETDFGSVRPEYDFGVGYPDPDSFPSAHLQEAVSKVLTHHVRDMVLYPHLQGHPMVRSFIADKLSRDRQMRIDPSEIVLTAGSGPAIALTIQLLVNPGETVVAEEFAFNGTLNMLRSLRTQVVGVSMDAEGMRPDALEQTIQDLTRQGRKPKFIYTIPTFQNPVGTDMGSDRRQDILRVAQKHGVPIFEDDCYEDLRFAGLRSPAIHSYDESETVLYCGSFSKILGAGMRLGFLVAPKELVPRIVAMNYSRPPSQFASLAATYYLQEHLYEHIAELRDVFGSRKDTMLAAIGEHMGPSVSSSNPDGGIYLWLRFQEGVDTTTTVTTAQEKGVAYTAGPIYSPTGEGKNFIRLCFGYENNTKIETGIAILADHFRNEGILK
ncbi:MAG: PLP-dependent aminotransferase family protein [Dehalococcoidia bacterium]